MKRKKEWFKFGGLVVAAAALSVGFVSIVDRPVSARDQLASVPSVLTTPPPQQQVIPAATPLNELGTAFTAVAETVRPAVVYIDGRRRQQESQSDNPFGMFRNQPRQQVMCGAGSGFIISDDGYILTNNHVIQDCDRVDVRLFDQRIIERATVVGKDRLTDVAVLKIDEDNLPYLGIANSDSVRVGEWVIAVGNPLGDAFSFTVTAGIVSGRGRRLEGLRNPDDPANQLSIQDFIQTDAAINRGNSGGPLVNIRGQVIGINSAIASTTGFNAGYGFAIPTNLVRNVADQLIASGVVTRAQLGVSIQEADEELADFVGLDEIRGVLVAGFSEENSPANRAGIREGDVIVELDGQQVDYVAQLQQIVGFKRPGDVVEVTVLRRDGERSTHNVRLTQADTDPAPALASTESERPVMSGSQISELGISIEPFGRREAREIGLSRDTETGLIVTQVDPDGPSQAKLNTSSVRRGIIEVITHVNDQRVESVDDLENALRGVPAGEVVPVRTVTITANGAAARPVFIRVAEGGR